MSSVRALKKSELTFLPDAVQIMDSRVPFAARAALFFILGLIAFAVAWACVGKVDIMVTAPGRIVSAQRPVVIQPIQSAIIRSINVREGDVVEKGQVLASLDPTFSEADAAEIASREEYLQALAQRIEAELAGKSVPPSDNPLVEGQVRLMEARIALQHSKLAGLKNEVDTLRQKIQACADEQNRLRLSLQSLNEIEESYHDLYQKRMCSKLEFLKAREDRRVVERKIAEAGDLAVQTGEQLKKAKAELSAQEKNYRAELTSSLVDARQELEEIHQRQVKADRIREMVVLRAPRSGVVQEVADMAAGSLAREGEALMVLAPRGGTVEADVEIPAKDIGRVQTGGPVRMKLEAFPFQRHGVVLGTVSVISPDAFLQQSGESVIYRAKVRIDKLDLRNIPMRFRLIPGMQLSAEMNVGQRTLISYFLAPIIRGLDEAFREAD
ncbi:MAG: HlyD family type I secretion periplasmic adaptor subunit [Desulfovibrio sp.]|uniref:HlyD family type I secretion periplasmic adaptor subunit n=1 Tax=Desulfovibrio sp. 7SRBS1 TaxID=3378064 RepID=UPI003B3D6E2E